MVFSLENLTRGTLMSLTGTVTGEEYPMETSDSDASDDTRTSQERLQPGRLNFIETSTALPAGSDAAFSMKELQSTDQNTSGKALGRDDFLSDHFPPGTRWRTCITAPYQLVLGQLYPSTSRKRTDIVPIPKPRKPGRCHPIFLLGYLCKMAEMMLLNQLQR